MKGECYGYWAGVILDWTDWSWSVFGWLGCIILGDRSDAKVVELMSALPGAIC
jgi:hypothetical protein